ncbi:unnamed protein product [Amoebophrya sp. A120]|nr:unnamed protein product [Amoebophrya sp. A120]|eukprot:GSA120T00011657001.1
MMAPPQQSLLVARPILYALVVAAAGNSQEVNIPRMISKVEPGGTTSTDAHEDQPGDNTEALNVAAIRQLPAFETVGTSAHLPSKDVAATEESPVAFVVDSTADVDKISGGASARGPIERSTQRKQRTGRVFLEEMEHAHEPEGAGDALHQTAQEEEPRRPKQLQQAKAVLEEAPQSGASSTSGRATGSRSTSTDNSTTEKQADQGAAISNAVENIMMSTSSSEQNHPLEAGNKEGGAAERGYFRPLYHEKPRESNPKAEPGDSENSSAPTGSVSSSSSCCDGYGGPDHPIIGKGKGKGDEEIVKPWDSAGENDDSAPGVPPRQTPLGPPRRNRTNGTEEEWTVDWRKRPGSELEKRLGLRPGETRLKLHKVSLMEEIVDWTCLVLAILCIMAFLIFLAYYRRKVLENIDDEKRSRDHGTLGPEEHLQHGDDSTDEDEVEHMNPRSLREAGL